MKRQVTNEEDWLNVLTVIGRILFGVPVGASIVAILYYVFSSGGGLSASSGDIFLFNVIMLCGLTTLIYVSIKKFQRGLRGKD